jgi:16S rRNA (guanine527-N7)-methyltransferase
MAVLRAPPAGWAVARVADGLGATVSEEARAKLVQWLDLVVAWNARVDLTAARSEAELVDLMLADALVVSSRVPKGARLVDVGAGAGAPGLPLAIVRPDLQVTLVEPLRKRVSFLRTVLGTIDRLDVAVDARKGEALIDTAEFDVAISRATLPPAQWLSLGVQLVKNGGAVWVLLAKESASASAGVTLDETVEYALPLTRVPRRAVRYVRA